MFQFTQPEPQTRPAPRLAPRPTPRSVELFTTIALAFSTLVAVTAVSIGIARADRLNMRADSAPYIMAHDQIR